MNTKENHEMLNRNKVEIVGAATTYPEFSHEVFGESFYTMDVTTERTSGYPDVIPVTVSERLFNREDYVGMPVKIKGQVRSYNRVDEDKTRLMLSVFAMDIADLPAGSPHENEVALDGYLCKTPTYRRTPFGREVTDMLVAVNRPYGKSDYIPCICWGRNARYASQLNVGDRIQITGRIQSRKYCKKLPNGAQEERTAIEVSVMTIKGGESNARTQTARLGAEEADQGCRVGPREVVGVI